MKSKRYRKASAWTFLAAMMLTAVSSFGVGSSDEESHRRGVALKHGSGDDEIDQIRQDIRIHPTDETNYEYRGHMLRIWEISMRQQGAILAKRFTPAYVNPSSINNLEDEMERRAAITRLAKRIDEGYEVLGSILTELREDPATGITPLRPDPDRVTPPLVREQPWPQYQGTLTHVGFNGTDGPVHGRTAWQFPVGLAWESRPVVDGKKVYLTSPGVRNLLFTLDLHTGKVIETVKKMPYPGSVYSNPAGASTPIVLRHSILVREMGSRGNTGPAKEVVYIDRETMEVEREVFSGHVDYRVGYPPLAANEKYMVYPFSIHELEKAPPEVRAFDHLICKDTRTGEQIRAVHIGQTFAEPLLDENMVFIGTNDGYVYGIDASIPDKPHSRAVMARKQEVTWAFKADGGVNRRVAANAKQVYFGANDGSIYCLDKMNGELVWEFSVEKPVAEAFRHFSTPLVAHNRVFVGSADNHVYCLNASNGELVFKYASSDWVRARPVATQTHVYFASINGDLYKIDYRGNQPKEVWRQRIGDHWIYADLVLAGNMLVLNDSDLYCYGIDTQNGDVRWRFSILKAFHQEDGYRIVTDPMAGGGYYQSKPTAAGGQIFIGTPSRFVYALNAETGKEHWKFELGAAISGAPVWDNDRIFIGQQGGEDDFYCLDARTGKLIWKQNVGWVWGSAAVSDGLVFVPGIDGFVNCLDSDDGNIVWRFRTDKSVCSEPMVWGDYVYFGSWDDFLYKFEKRTGKLVWKIAGGGSDSGVTIGFEGKLILPGAGMTCVDEETTEVLWKPDLTGSTNGTPAYHDDQVFISMWAGLLIAVDAHTGKKNWVAEQVAGITAPSIGANGYVYCGSRGNPYFYALHEKGNGDGTTDTLFRVKMANGILESVPALYRGRAYILSAGGYLYAIE